MSDVFLWVMFGVMVLLVLLCVWVWRASRKEKRPTDYYTLFIIGMFWFVLGFPLDNFALWAIGLIFMVVSMMHKKEWKKNRKDLKRMSKKETRLIMLVVAALAIILTLTTVVLLVIK